MSGGPSRCLASISEYKVWSQLCWFVHKRLIEQLWFLSRVAVLDGGLPAWKAKGHEVETVEVTASTIAAPVGAMKLNSTEFDQCTCISTDKVQ